MATTRDQIRKLAERLNDVEAEEALEYIRWLIAAEDTEPLSEAEKRDIEDSKAEQASGGGEDWEKVKRDLGL